ncbi:hypothetical protein GCM10027075_46720 [Streptomyces heilongjiangensis]
MALLTVLGASACGGGAGAAGGGNRGTSRTEGSPAHTGDGVPSGAAPTSPDLEGKSSGLARTAASPLTRKVPWNLDILDQRTRPLNGRLTTKATGKGVHVYVIDTGMDISHKEFGRRAHRGADFVGPKDSGDCFSE